MKKILLLFVLIAQTVFFYTACYYDKEQLLYNSSAACDTTGTFSYTQKVVPLFRQHCYGCHTGNYPSGNVLMGTYSADKVIGANGKLFGSINHSPGYSAMPQGTSKFSSCQIALVKKWIDQGMPNN